MDGLFRRFLTSVCRNSAVVSLAFVWFLGLFLGTVLAAFSGNSYYLLMHAAAFSRVSIVGLIASVFLPFLFSAFAVYTCKPKLVYLICFIKAVLLAQGAFGAVCAFGSAAWLARFLLQFSDMLLTPLFCWFSVRLVSGTAVLKRDFILCCAAFLIVGTLDYCVVSPFLAMLIDI